MSLSRSPWIGIGHRPGWRPRDRLLFVDQLPPLHPDEPALAVVERVLGRFGTQIGTVPREQRVKRFSRRRSTLRACPFGRLPYPSKENSSAPEAAAAHVARPPADN